jgi:hypothetical protein
MNVIPIRAGRVERPNRCVISLGIGKKTFKDSLVRLEESLRRVRFEGDYICWSDQLPEGSPEHFDVPFGFKPYCFFAARKLGYEEILWMDSVCIALRSLDPVFHLIQNNGYALFNNNYGQWMGQWCSDEALVANGLTREEALRIPEMPCSVIGLDMRSPLAIQFLEEWHRVMADGITARGTKDPVQSWEEYQDIFWNRNQRISTDPRVKGHRCDQPAAGIVAHRLGMTPYADALRDIHYKETAVNRHTSILHHREFGATITPLDDIYYNVLFRTPFIDSPRQKARKVLSKLKRFTRSLA